MTTQRWCIIGGGLMGLTLAHRLSDAGHAVTVKEAAPELGGLASAWQLGDLTWDRHYHVTLLSDLKLRGLLTELGLEQDMRWTVTQTGFFAGPEKLYQLNNAFDYLRFPPLNLIDKVRLAATILYISKLKDGRRLETIPVADWLTRLSGRRVFDRIWRPLLRAKLGDNYTRTSAAFIWAVVKRLYAARASGLKEELFGYLPGGYGRMLDTFAASLTKRGVALHLACPVKRIESVPGGGVQVASQTGTELYDQVVVTLPASLATKLVIGLDADEKRRLNGIVYQGIVCASVLLKNQVSPYYLTYITDESIPFTAVVDMSSLVSRQEFTDRGLLYLPKYVTADDPFWQVSDADAEDMFLDGLMKIYPDVRREDVLAFRISRVKHVLAISTLNYSDHLPPMTTSVQGVHIVNSAHIVNGTLNVNETVGLAEAAIPQLLAAAGAVTAMHDQERVA